ncbi:4-hydroxybenzoate octaprenyltransferase [Ehrlichia minasensis]|uniref:4-hydroxybenzoate octaprenyltransferase n=1 Tax=Ehrlichia minasensis TaxID=1242993 RepID=A0A4Q6ICN4_9RICK|nr:4-hydroxybenzoate octaprenyltransferase [Ehrlichia minasensis]RZB13118.1 4-hydroxybenzoate octaprenyltransferase [Ehrlichia minasensis]
MLCKLKNIVPNFEKYIELLGLHMVETFFLALFPGLASVVLVSHDALSACWYMFLCIVGTNIVKPAGCIINCICDREIDAKVKRTKNRPLADKSLTVVQALKVLVVLLLCSCMLLLFTNMYTVKLSIITMVLIVLYPLSKRFFAWPQFLLGLVFNSGALLVCSMITGRLTLSCILLYIGCIFWTVGYDTIYAAQDRECDIKLGLNSTALRFGNDIRLWVGRVYTIAIIMWTSSGIVAMLHPIFYIAILMIAIVFYYQYKKSDFDDSEKCMYMFNINAYVGLILFVGTLLGRVVR